MRLSGYMDYPTKPYLIAIIYGMEYLMHHPHEPIMYTINKISQTTDSPRQCLFKAGDVEINKIRNTPTSSIYIVMQITQRDSSEMHSFI